MAGWKWAIAVVGIVGAAAVAAGMGGAADGLLELAPGVMVRDHSDAFEYFANPWSVIGLKDHPSGVRISPSGDLFFGDQLIVRPLAGTPLRPLNPRIRWTLRDGWLPIATASFTVDDRVRYTLEAAVTPMDPARDEPFDRPEAGNFLCFLRMSMTNVSAEAANADVGLQWRPGAGDVPLELTAVSPGVEGVRCRDRLFAALRPTSGASVQAEGSLVRVRARLEPRETQGGSFVLPFHAVADAELKANEAMPGCDFASAEARVASFWRRLLGQGAVLEVPEAKVLETYRASLVYLFIGRDQGEVRGGEGFYDETYLRDGIYQVTALAQAGFLEEARLSMELMMRFQRPDGRFESQKDQFDANGYAMWGPVELFRLSGDLAWLESVYPAIRSAARWLEEARRREEDPDSPFFGILPAGVADGEFLWDGRHHIVGYDLQNLRGLLATAEAARALGRGEEAEALARESADYRESILRALERTGLPHIPPSYENAGTHWGNLEAIFPTVLLDPFDPRVSATIRLVRTGFGRTPVNPGGYIEGVIQWNPPHSGAIHPYLTKFVTNAHLVRGEQEEALDGFYSFLLHSTSTHGFPEGVYWRHRVAWSNTIPHLWGAALQVTTLRNMILREQGDELHLLSCVPDHWLTTAPGIRVRNAPTHFGRLDLTAAIAEDALQVEVRPPDRRAPTSLVIHAPVGMVFEEAQAGGQPLAGVLPAHVRLDPRLAGEGPIRLRVRRLSDRPGMTFRSRVAAYLADAPPLPAAVSGVVPTPSPDELAGAGHVCLDLSGAATTNSLTSPFNVPDPGRFVFAGLPTGELKVCGVPVRILDPSAGSGRNLVVLHGAHACQTLPREVEVAAGDTTARYLCILGNVTGWAAGTPGSEQHDALAEYEIRYADGEVETVPLITDRTADDWTGPALAREAEIALRGDPWHLNLLTIALKPRPVRSIVVRDLGTPASPVVAAMTLIR